MKAAAAYRKAVALEPEIPELWANLGLMDHEAGNHVEAVSSFRRAIRLNPDLFVPQLFLGMEYLRENKAEAAIPYLENAARLNPKDVQALRLLGQAHATTGRIDEAIDLDWQALQLNENNGNLWFDLGTAYLQQVENAARLMTSAYGDSKYVRLRSAEVLATEGKLIEAEKAYRDALASTEYLPCAFAELGITLLREQEAPAAQQQFERELQSGYQCKVAELGLAILDADAGRTEDALSRLSRVAGADAGFVRTSLPLFRGSIAAEKIQSLIAVARTKAGVPSSVNLGDLIESAFASDDISTPSRSLDEPSLEGRASDSPSDAQHDAVEGEYARCSYLLRSELQSEDAERLKLLAFCSFYAADYLTTSRVAQKLKRDAETRVQGLYWESKAGQNLSIQALGRAGEIEANSPRMHVLLGDVFRQQHQWDDAEAEYRKAIVLEPKSHSARLGLAITLFTGLSYDEALSLDLALLSEDSQDPEANLLAGEILVQRNKFREAEPYLLRCAGLKSEQQPRYHALLGRVYEETDRVRQAIAEYKLGLTTDQDGRIHYQLARLYQKTGNKAAADEAFRESKRLVDRSNERERNVLGQSGESKIRD